MSSEQGATATEAVACTLAPSGLADRVSAWRELAARALTRTEEPGRVATTYPRDPELIEDLTRLIAAEGECCSFLRFEVREQGDVVEVELAYPPGFEAALREVIGGRP